MFVRKKKNKSGKVSVQIISKSAREYKVVKTVGCSDDVSEIDKLVLEANQMIPEIMGQLPLGWETEFDKKIDEYLGSMANAQINVIGPELILGSLFDRIGFNIFPSDLFRHLVIARLVYPGSKLKTIDYLQRYKNVFVSSDRIYRFMDELQNKYKERVEKISFEHTKKILHGNITVVFYDMTTLYFEIEDEDDLRRIGFSKDGKFQQPQIMIGLLVGENGYPIGYDIFKGNTFEGHTFLPILQAIGKKYDFPNPIVVADAGLLSKDNIEILKNNGYTFIIGARIKNETDVVKENIFKQSVGLEDGGGVKIEKTDGTWLIVTYSGKRKKKDSCNREKGLKKLKKQIQSGKLTKKHINNRGYNKFLKITGKLEVIIDEEKIKADSKWDGLKGYVTNTELSVDDVVKNYTQLWQVEKAFRISKTDLRIRPIYHQLKNRIEAHICISFTAYAIYKELERLLQKNKIGISAKRAIELTQNMYKMTYILPDSKKQKFKYLKMDNDQQILFKMMAEN
ncbi:MAG: IS1634 family transposase [Elusimicrobiota bacterium]